MRNRLIGLKRIPGRPERGLYWAVIAVLTISLLALMSVHRSQRDAWAERADAWETFARGVSDSRGHDLVYIGVLEDCLSAYQKDSTPDQGRAGPPVYFDRSAHAVWIYGPGVQPMYSWPPREGLRTEGHGPKRRE